MDGERSQRHLGGFIRAGFMLPQRRSHCLRRPSSPPSSPSFWTVTSGAQYCHIPSVAHATDGAGSYGNRSPAQFVLTPRYGFLQLNLTLRIGTTTTIGVEIPEGLYFECANERWFCAHVAFRWICYAPRLRHLRLHRVVPFPPPPPSPPPPSPSPPPPCSVAAPPPRPPGGALWSITWLAILSRRK